MPHHPVAALPVALGWARGQPEALACEFPGSLGPYALLATCLRGSAQAGDGEGSRCMAPACSELSMCTCSVQGLGLGLGPW